MQCPSPDTLDSLLDCITTALERLQHQQSQQKLVLPGAPGGSTSKSAAEGARTSTPPPTTAPAATPSLTPSPSAPTAQQQHKHQHLPQQQLQEVLQSLQQESARLLQLASGVQQGQAVAAFLRAHPHLQQQFLHWVSLEARFKGCLGELNVGMACEDGTIAVVVLLSGSVDMCGC
jgi:hypothetical protein